MDNANSSTEIPSTDSKALGMFSHSPSLSEYNKALLSVQMDLNPIVISDSENPHFKSRYASLATVLATIRGVYNNNGFIIVQYGGEIIPVGPKFACRVYTNITHAESGQFCVFFQDVPTDLTAQAIGSAITYGRRYSLLCQGLAPVDDDAEAALLESRMQSGRAAPAEVARHAVDQRNGQRLDVTRQVDVNLPSPPPEANGSAKSAARGRPRKATGHARVIIDAIGACSTQGDLEAVKHSMLSPRIAAYKDLSEVDKTECCIVYSAKSMELAEDSDSVEKSFAFACGRKEFGSLELKKRMYVCHIYYMAMLRVLNDIESIGNVYVTAKESDWDNFTHKQKSAIEDSYALRIAEIQASTAFESQKHSLLKALRRDEGQAINA